MLNWQEEFDFGPRDRSIQERFEDFHAANPRIYDLLVRFARDAKRAGRRQYGIAAIFERVRWHIYIETQRDDDFKLNNDYRSRYARMIMDREPDLAEFFELRELKTE